VLREMKQAERQEVNTRLSQCSGNVGQEERTRRTFYTIAPSRMARCASVRVRAVLEPFKDSHQTRDALGFGESDRDKRVRGERTTCSNSRVDDLQPHTSDEHHDLWGFHTRARL
jgi:hypothetical protein